MSGAHARASWRDWSCTVEVTVTEGRHLDAAVDVVRELMAEVDQAASRFRADSELERVNQSAGRLVLVRPLTFRLVETAVRAARLTRGAVDPTLGAALVDLGYDADIALVRDRIAPPARARGAVGRWRAVRLDRTLVRVGVPRGTRLDLGATAKAWAADEAARRIHRRLGCGVLVALGGDLAALGRRPTPPWRVDVAETAGASAARVGLTEGGLATSSVLGRRWTAADGSTHHHVIDPSTGRPTAGRWRTATVWAPTALAANVVSTWFLVDEAGARAHLCDRGLAARLVAADGDVCRLGGWPNDAVMAS